MPRTGHSTELKTRVVLAALERTTTIAALARREGVGEGCIYRWRERFIQGGTKALSPAAPKRKVKSKRRKLVDATLLQTAETKSVILKRYAGLMRTLDRKNARLSNELKREIVSVVEGSDLSKTAALRAINIPRTSYYSWCKNLRETGDVAPPPSITRKVKVTECEQIKKAVFEVLHSPPIDFGYNRTTWKIAD